MAKKNNNKKHKATWLKPKIFFENLHLSQKTAISSTPNMTEENQSAFFEEAKDF